MTWKEFKDFVESEGVKDEMTLDYIDIHCYPREEELNISIHKDVNEFTVWS